MPNDSVLLLPHFTSLRLALENGAFRIEAVPEWLAGYLGRRQEELLGKNADSEVLPSPSRGKKILERAGARLAVH